MEKNLFCAKCQILTKHVASIDGNGEFLFECQQVNGEGEDAVKCDRFIKMPADITKAQFQESVVVHKLANEGQIPVEVQEKKLADLLTDDIDDTVTTPNEPVAEVQA